MSPDPRLQELRAQDGWVWDEIGTGHDAMISAPGALADMLLKLA
ncbi:hypothetical protein P3T23_000671 [Paraburkholderia sp. GAS448]